MSVLMANATVEHQQAWYVIKAHNFPCAQKENVFVAEPKVNMWSVMAQLKDPAHQVRINANPMEHVLSVCMIQNVPFWLMDVN